jgi:hypothetical protein
MIVRGVGSIGTITGASIRGRFGSFLQSRILNGSFGGTVSSQLLKARFGSFTGTVQSPIIRSQRGSFANINIRAGTVVATQIKSGTVPQVRVFQYVGTIIKKFFNGGEIRTRYVVWPVAFTNATYRPVVQIEIHDSNDSPFATGVLSRRTGSMQYYVVNRSAGAIGTPGTIHLYGFPNV